VDSAEFLHNVTLLVTLCVIDRLVVRRWDRRTVRGRMICGLLLGGTAVVGMMTPWQVLPGVVFDGRSVLVSLAGLFGGWLSALLAATPPILYRLAAGGDGVLTGSVVVAVSALLGTAAHHHCRCRPDTVSASCLLGLGVAVHVAMVLLMLTLPGGRGVEVMRQIAVPVLLLLPLATVVVGKVFQEGETQWRTAMAQQESEARYRSLFDDCPVAILEEDLSAVHEELARLRSAGVNDIDSYLTARPDAVERCASLVRVVAANQEALRLLGARRQEDLRANLGTRFGG